MGSSISAIYNDYRDYVSLCEKLQTEPLPIRDTVTNGTEKWKAHYEKLSNI